MINYHDEQTVHDLIYQACVYAVKETFAHLTVRDIITPPHQWFDAALARQIALHLTIRLFNVSKRRVVKMQSRSREAINRGLETIDTRLEEPCFAEHYNKMALIAQSLFDDTLAEAA